MCLAIPMKVESITNNNAKVGTGNVSYNVNITMIPNVRINDYVIVHAGFAIEILDKEEADIRIKLFKEMEELL